MKPDTKPFLWMIAVVTAMTVLLWLAHYGEELREICLALDEWFYLRGW